MERTKRNRSMLILYIVLLILTLALVLWFGRKPHVSVKVGYITPYSIDDPVQGAADYPGIQAASKTTGVELLTRAQVPTSGEECLKAVKELRDKGAEMIVLSHNNYAGQLDALLQACPDVYFYGLDMDTEYTAEHVTSYCVRMYQMRYLNGIIAGLQTKTGRVGFVAAAKTCEAYRNVNAFALGVQRVAPDVQVVLAWSEDWDETGDPAEAAARLIEEEGLDVITYQRDSSFTFQAAEQAGIYSMGCYEDMPGASDNFLTCASCDWALIYGQLIQEYLRGQSNLSRTDWLGMESGAVYLTEYSPLVTQAARDEVELAKEEFLSGRAVFSGTIYDTEGTLRCATGEAISDDSLLWHTYWLVKGVRVYGDE